MESNRGERDVEEVVKMRRKVGVVVDEERVEEVNVLGEMKRGGGLNEEGGVREVGDGVWDVVEEIVGRVLVG